jgi:hypothetical protein
LKTGSTDFRDTEVQQPKTTATLSLVISSRAFSANSGQLEAGSTTTASSFLPSRPPLAFCSWIMNRTVSFRVVSLIAIVPDSECSTPTLIVSCAEAVPPARAAAAPNAAAVATLANSPFIEFSLSDRAVAQPSWKGSQGECQPPGPLIRLRIHRRARQAWRYHA